MTTPLERNQKREKNTGLRKPRGQRNYFNTDAYYTLFLPRLLYKHTNNAQKICVTIILMAAAAALI